jgi:hypothetical protein
MKAIISIAALAVAFASVSAHELRGGPVVSMCPTFVCISLFLSPIIHTLTSFLSPLLISLARILGDAMVLVDAIVQCHAVSESLLVHCVR